MHVHEAGDHGRGLAVRDGDVPVVPAGWLRVALNPLHGNVRLSRNGLSSFVTDLFVRGMPEKATDLLGMLDELERQTDSIVAAFPPLKGLDVNDAQHSDDVMAIMMANRETREFWAYSCGNFVADARKAIGDGDTQLACWNVALAERCRSMMLFKGALEEVVWMGHSAGRIIDILQIWDANKQNSDEEFWQLTFNENAYVLSQVFAVPMLFIQDKAHVGGMKLDRSDARFVDYVFSVESSREVILIEIKTPATPLLGAEYRGNRAPSKDLAGSVVQALNYRDLLTRNLGTLTDGTGHHLRAFQPRCSIIVGNSADELKDEVSRRSFELFRRSLSNIEIVTYDELFRKVEILAELFNLKRKTQ